MIKPFIADKTFKGQDFSINRLQTGEYENCIFSNCNFADGYLDNQNFTECEFIECNLSNTNVVETVFNDVLFTQCKILGVKFNECNKFIMSFSFSDCIMNFSSFYTMKLPKFRFDHCKLIDVDFTEADLTQAIFQSCDLGKAVFNNTILEKADFSTAYNYRIDPEQNKIKKARFSKEGLEGLLFKYDIQIDD
tara:strand:- start:1158 stop:1733 length:576 start_codon:yes stop_codon:yes gene_type:complete